MSLIYYYYLIHIPITLLIDSTVLIPPVFEFQKAIVSFHIDFNNDFLLKVPPLWFKIFIFFELIFQLPYFFVYCFHLKDKPSRYIGDIIYGLNASLTTFVCLIYALNEKNYPLMGVYGPYCLIPLLIMINGIKNLNHIISPVESDKK
ncbi:uncharacterized membrane protein [[Candida] jaroonii]|uniref:Uncharacterized membrane protein n=1 Tax=[Candida] jaroonii TaxID=467808 RepID=A0ACA9Y7X2_9ASCO|nr:uncharacterized membrane protein [[Candida] jaroonii]